MFRYKLNELLNDKELCKKVITKNFYLRDGGGEFKTLDFENNSMRHNHIKTFEQLYAIGGKKLFGAILADGKTCLTDNPNAAKVGVVAIEGADGYYLKSNVSAIVAFMSILNAVKHIGDVEELFDMDDIYVEYEDRKEELLADVSEEDMEYMEKLDRIHSGEQNEQFEQIESFGTYDEADEFDEQKFYEQKLEIKQGDAGFFLCDEESGEQVTFECNSGIETEQISVMYDIQPLGYKEVVGSQYNDGIESDITEDRVCGYRYQLEKDGKWGFISEHFAYFIYPIYEDILVNKQGEIVGYYFENDLKITISVAYPANYESEDGFSEYDKVLHGPEHKYAVSDPSKEIYILRNVTADYIPGLETRVSYIYENFSAVGIAYTSGAFLSDVYDKGIFKCQNNNTMGFSCADQFDAKYERGFISLQKDTFTKTEVKKAPASEFNAKCCRIAYDWDTKDAIQYESCLEPGIYIAKREGYYALVEYDYNSNKISDYLTPFAFTNMYKTDTNCCVVERFGKKGV